MRILKLVIWDLDETILTGVLEEGDETINPEAGKLMAQLRNARYAASPQQREISPEVLQPVIKRNQWSSLFVNKRKPTSVRK